jgi:hypothetical protein
VAEAQERSLLFLRPLGRETTSLVEALTFWHVEHDVGVPPQASFRDDIDLVPASYQAKFCVSSDKGSQRLLEQDARTVVGAADALVAEVRRTSR